MREALAQHGGEAAAAAAEREFAAIDSLINNAAGNFIARTEKLSPNAFNAVVSIVLNGTFNASRAAGRSMIARGRGGVILNVIGIGGEAPQWGYAAGSTGNAALIAFSKAMGGHSVDYGIRVNAVAPGPVDTAMAKAVHTPEIRADYHDHIPLSRYGLEAELANAIFFLCNEQASYVTGQVLAVDGGFDAVGVGLPTLRGQRRNA